MFLLAQQTEALTPWAQFGLAGLVIGALFLYIWQKDKSHTAERAEYRNDIREIAANHDDVVKESNAKFAELHQQTLDVVTKYRPKSGE